MNTNSDALAPQIVFSSHAMKRGQQRGIKQKYIEIVAMYGRKSRVPGGLHQRFLAEKDIGKIRKLDPNLTNSEIEKTKGIAVLVKEGESENLRTVITVLPRTRVRKAS